MKIKDFDINQFEKSKKSKYKLGNELLYNLCLKHPGHINSDEIHAKIWLIGRSYAASIERRKTKNKINDNFYDEVIEEFIKFNSQINLDAQLNKLKGKEFNEETINDLLFIHRGLTNFFDRLTGLEKRSLASKYLHFHVPIFPIFDSRANRALSKIVQGNSLSDCGDKSYSCFCYKMLFLYNHIKKLNGKSPTLREIDNYLIEVANTRLNNWLLGERKDLEDE